MESVSLNCGLLIDSREIRSTHTAYEAGANVLTLVSCSAEVDFELHSSYVGSDYSPNLTVAELVCEGKEEAHSTRSADAEAGVLTYARRRCLYDHLQRIQDLLAARGLGPVQIHGLDAAARQLDAASLA